MSDIVERLREGNGADWQTAEEAAATITALREEVERLRIIAAAATPKPLDDKAPKVRVLIGVDRPPYEDKTYYYMVEWREDKQTWMTECGVDWDTGKYRYAFCGASHYLDPLELPGLPYWEGKDEEAENE